MKPLFLVAMILWNDSPFGYDYSAVSSLSGFHVHFLEVTFHMYFLVRVVHVSRMFPIALTSW